MTSDPAATPDTVQPRLADRLSALVGQAAARQDDGSSLERFADGLSRQLAELEHLVSEQTASTSSSLQELGERLQGLDSSVRGHVDEIGGALVVRLDELGGADDGAAARERSDAVASAVEGVARRLQATTDDLAAVAAGVVALTDRVEQLDASLGEQLAGLRSEQTAKLAELEAGLGRRIDEAALALAETVVALLGGGASTSPVAAAAAQESAWSAEETTSLPAYTEDRDLEEQELEQAEGTAEGSAELQPAGLSPAEAEQRRRSLFRR